MNKLQKIGAGALTMLASAGAMAQTTSPKDQVIAAVNAGGDDAKAVAVAVVIVLWSITAIYLMRRKG